jgi:hypothetical protein
VASLAGLGGLALRDENPEAMWISLTSGIATALVGITISGVSRRKGHQANGHAIDALNYYNDAVGARGGQCDRARVELPPAEQLPGLEGK